MKSKLLNLKKILYKNLYRRNTLKFQKRLKKRYKEFDKIRSSELFFRRLYEDDPLEKWQKIENWQALLENKLNSKAFAKKMGCRVSELYWTGGKQEFLNFDFSTLPKNYVIKPLVGKSTNNVFLMHGNKDLFSGNSFNKKELRTQLLKLFEVDNNLIVIIEEFIPNENGEFAIPQDFRIFTFNGEIPYLRVDYRSSLLKDRSIFYDTNWNKIDEKLMVFVTTEGNDVKPQHFEEMIEQARKLSKVYKKFIRLDFYNSVDGPVFGEFSYNPQNGLGYTEAGSTSILKYWDKHCKGLL